MAAAAVGAAAAAAVAEVDVYRKNVLKIYN
jgi:hypothetical protein